MEKNQKCYRWDSVLDFGKYKGKTLSDVYKISPSYMDWCLKTLKWFYIDEDTYTILANASNYNFSDQAKLSIIHDDDYKDDDCEDDDYVEDFSAQEDFNATMDAYDYDGPPDEFFNWLTDNGY